MAKNPTRVQPEVMPEPGEAGMYTNKIHYLRKYLLDEVVTKKFALDFMEPVDTALLEVPNYYAVIKRPMDVGTIIKRVQNRYYHRVDDLISDFQLVISNCFMFNRPGDVVYRNCQKLEKFFHRVINKMPKGEEKPSTKDPRAPGRQHGYEKASEVVQRQCQEHLAKLHIAISKEDDPSICKYFRAKFDALSQKVDRFYFKTIEEFRFEVTGIFKTFDNHIRAFHELFHRTCGQDSLHYLQSCQWSYELDGSRSAPEPSSSDKMEKRDVTDVLYALKKAETSVEHCIKSYTREKASRAKVQISEFEASANKLKEKLSTGRKVKTTQEERKRVAQIFYNKLPEETSEEESFEESDLEEVEEPMEDNSKVQVFRNRDADSDSDSGSGPGSGSSSDADADGNAEAAADADDESVTDEESDADAAVGVNPNANAVKADEVEIDESETESGPDTNAESSAESDAATVAETDANAAKTVAADEGTIPPNPIPDELINATLWTDLQMTSSEDGEDN